MDKRNGVQTFELDNEPAPANETKEQSQARWKRNEQAALARIHARNSQPISTPKTTSKTTLKSITADVVKKGKSFLDNLFGR